MSQWTDTGEKRINHLSTNTKTQQIDVYVKFYSLFFQFSSQKYEMSASHASRMKAKVPDLLTDPII